MSAASAQTIGAAAGNWGTLYAQRPLLFHNSRDGRFEEVPPLKGRALATPISGRGAAFGDLFINGKILDGPRMLLKNIASHCGAQAGPAPAPTARAANKPQDKP